MVNRWWIYQRERFPVFDHGLLIAVFSFSAVTYSSLLRNAGSPPAWKSLWVAFGTTFLFFLQLRIADEFKDHVDDSRYRPYRPVPRGLVKLSELRNIGFAAAFVQLGLAVWLDLSLIPLLTLVWLYLCLMCKEFFVPGWLKRHLFTYMWTHMIIMPLMALYAAACDWLIADSQPPEGLGWFLGLSFFNGLVIEIGRKIRAPEDEERGVETYSSVWGRRSAIGAWLGAMVLTGASVMAAAERIGIFASLTGLMAALFVLAVVLAWYFLAAPSKIITKLIPALSGIWTLLIYSSLGAPLWLVGRIW